MKALLLLGLLNVLLSMANSAPLTSLSPPRTGSTFHPAQPAFLSHGRQDREGLKEVRGLPRENSPSPGLAGLGSKDSCMEVSTSSSLTSWFLYFPGCGAGAGERRGGRTGRGLCLGFPWGARKVSPSHWQHGSRASKHRPFCSMLLTSLPTSITKRSKGLGGPVDSPEGQALPDSHRAGCWPAG